MQATEPLGPNVRVVRAERRRTVEIDGDFVRGLAVARTGATEVEVWDCALAPNASTVIHSHDAEQVIVVMEGSMTVEVEGQRAIVEPGDAVVIPHGVVHQLHNGTALNRHLGICGRIGTKTILQNGEELTPEWQQ